MKGAGLKRVPGTNLPKKKKKGENTKLYNSPPNILFRDPIGHELPLSLLKFRWDGDKVKRKLQEKIQEKTQIAGNFVYQQAYRLLEGTRGEGIDFVSFREQLRVKFGILLDDSELRLLFDKYDEDGNGKIDMQEFIRRVLPPDYNYGRQWFEISQLNGEEKAARLRHEARQEFLVCQGIAKTNNINNMGVTSNWTINELMNQIQAKVVQKTPSSEDQYRRAFKMLRSGRDQGIRLNELQFNLKTKFGIYASDDQMRQLFTMCDQDSNGEIDLREFLQFVDPPAYPANSKVRGGIWTQSDSEGEDTDSEKIGLRCDTEAVAINTEQFIRPATALSRRYASSECSDGNSAASLDKLMRGKIERPRTANPRKMLGLQQKRDMVEKERLTRCNLQRTFSMSVQNLEARSLASKCEEDDEYSCHFFETPRQQSGIVDCSEAETERFRSRSDRSYTRPRSAGSVRSYASSSSSIKGATYMKRPSSPQTLRQKCQEARELPAATKVFAMAQSRQAPLKTTQTSVKQWNCQAQSLDTGQRHSLSETSLVFKNRNVCNRTYTTKKENDAEEYAPRISYTHAMQHDERPYTVKGRCFAVPKEVFKIN